ncbi:MAG: aminoacyl-histidine dipeptidase [Oscillospiraceae bacterium]|nr:aminoacyl-histidine dipeptidase [Oscillospiraceae bacterium]
MKSTIVLSAIVLGSLALLSACDETTQTTTPQSKIGESAYAYFVEISQIPRTSGNEQAISDYLKAFGEERDFETVQDEWLNVLIKKPGSPGREDESPIILQAHMDMVGEKNNDVEHDFLTDPIVPVIDGDWVTAEKKTNLGADNGVGLAMMLAILDANGLSHPPIEALITVEEETTAIGAIEFDVTLLLGNRMINVDSTDEGHFVVSSASGTTAVISIPIETTALSEDFTTYELTVKGLNGGHSGDDINKGFANANVLMGKLLEELNATEFYLTEINGGSAHNAIPRESAAVISLNDLSTVEPIIGEMQAAFIAEYPVETALSITLTETETAESVMTADSMQKVITGITQMPNGVQTMSADIEGLVQTSNNLGVIATEDGKVILTAFARSSLPQEEEELIDSLNSLAASINAEAEIEKSVPAWPYKADSPLQETMVEVYTAMYGTAPIVEAIHAGLETAEFALKMPDCDIISIGPDIQNYHSPDEKFSLSSFNRTCDFLVSVLEALS